MPEGLLPHYRSLTSQGRLKEDLAQRLAVEKLQILHNRLDGYTPAAPKKVRLGMFGWGREKLEERSIPGLYLYGGVGRGKSMLMDLFYQWAEVEPRRRVHFHAFMQEVHKGIHTAREAGVQDPILPVADGIADSATLLCFDEMQITDITDAMIVGRLFERLFARGVVIVATSNRHPDELYKDGLNRNLFLPFIDLIKKQLEIHHLDSETDHRRNRLSGLEIYHTPLGDPALAAMDKAWEELAGGTPEILRLPRQGRELVIAAHQNGVARDSFANLCEAPLGPGDYLALAEAVRVLILEDIPIMGRENANAAKRFVTLIDALYEAGVRLVASAAAEPEALYPDGPGAFEFARTASRIAEMRSADWPDGREGALASQAPLA